MYSPPMTQWPVLIAGFNDQPAAWWKRRTSARCCRWPMYLRTPVDLVNFRCQPCFKVVMSIPLWQTVSLVWNHPAFCMGKLETSVFLRPCSIAMFVYQRILYVIGLNTILSPEESHVPWVPCPDSWTSPSRSLPPLLAISWVIYNDLNQRPHHRWWWM